MIIDLFEGGTAAPRYDVVIVGTGPAGITVATELAGSGLSIGALESGGTTPRPSTDRLRATVSAGIEIKEHSRERVFGGTSTTWAALSRPLRPADFDGEHGDPWPISYDDIEPYYRLAVDRYGFPSLESFDERGLEGVRARSEFAPDWDRLTERVYLAPRKAPNFAKEHRDTFARDDVDAILGATVVSLEADEGGTVRAVRYRDPSGNHLRIACGRVVLACGGIENARLLLASRDRHPAGLGNDHDQVGRHLMNHPKNPAGEVVFDPPVREVPHLFGCMVGGQAGYCGLHLRQGEGLLDSYLRFEPIFPWSDRRGITAFLMVVKRSNVLLDLFARRQHGKVVSLRDYAETGDESDLQNARKVWQDWAPIVWAMAHDAPWIAQYLYYRLRRSASPQVSRVRIRNFMEMEPAPHNRVTLATASDEHGEPLPHVAHACGPRDRRSVVALHDALSLELTRLGVGRVVNPLRDLEPWPIDRDASHHMGTTRMGVDPKTSVVDANARLHGSTNTFVAGSSVFTSSGSANPTFTIVALAARLADHIRHDAGLEPPLRRQVGAVRPRAASAHEGAKRVLVIGAGERAHTDVIPAIHRLDERYRIAGVVAQSRRRTAVEGVSYDVEALADLDRSALDGIDLVYIGVTKRASGPTIERILELISGSVAVLVDTPVLNFAHLPRGRRLLVRPNSWIAEDCATLPWLEVIDAAVTAGRCGRPRHLHLDRSAYRYHGFAMMRTILGSPVNAVSRSTLAKGVRFDARMANGTTASLVTPRNYAGGHFEIVTSDGATISDDPASATDGLLVVPVIEGGRCRGFDLGGVSIELTEPETAAAGEGWTSESVTNRMNDLKRAGLVRMLRDIDEGGGGYPVADGLDDMIIDTVVSRLGRWRSTPATSVTSSLAQRAVATASRR